MIPYQRSILLSCLKAFDIAVVGASYSIAAMVASYRGGDISIIEFLQMRVSIKDFLFFVAFLLGGYIVLSAFGMYQSRRFSSKQKEALDFLAVMALGAGTLWLASQVLDLSFLGPEFSVVFFAGASLLLISSRLIIRWALARIRVRGRNLRHMLIVGTNARAISFAKQIEKSPELGYHLIGFVDNEWSGSGESRQEGYKIVANFANFCEFVSNHVVDEVVIQIPMKSLYQIANDIAKICEKQGIIVRYLPDIFNMKFARLATGQLGDQSVVTLQATIEEGWPLLAKRLMDIVLSSFLLALLSPLFLVVAIAIKMTSPGPVFFVQDRVGLSKRRFRLYKFRTMVSGAENQIDELETFNEMDGPVFKIKDDPRITPLGRWLRKSSVDELPQLINVFKGDMSLVGPRPLPVRDFEGFDQDWHRRRFSVRPGITCLWQVNGRNNVSFDRWMMLDMQYIDQWSLSLDIEILAKTIPAVMRGHGAQ
jgi:exopolysaccharide biosynthesis polyprenyl glycosylphosphotransferase